MSAPRHGRADFAAFVAAEAGAAAWMAPVWAALDRPVSAWFGPKVADHLRRCNAPIPSRLHGLDDAIPLEHASILISSATGRACEAAAVAQAASRGIASLQVIDYWSGYARRFAGPWPDRIAVIDARARTEAIAEGLPEDRLVAVGQPSWEHAAKLEPAPLDRLVFVGQPVSRLYGDTLGYDERRAFGLLRDAQIERPDLIREIVYLLHPEEDEQTAPPGAAVTRDAQGALERCGTVAGMFSSLMAEALAGGRRVVSAQPAAARKDMCALSRHGRIGRVETVGELVDLLTRPVPPESGFGAELRGSTTCALRVIEELARA